MKTIDFGKPFGVGATADIYDIGDGKLFKRFHDNKDNHSINNEYNCSLGVQNFGLGAPKIYERVNDERGRGFIMERIDGVDLLSVILHDFKGSEDLIREWTRLHLKINSMSGLGFPTPQEALPYRLRVSEYLTDNEKESAIKLLTSMPRCNKLCHTDYHPGNVIITKDGVMRVIDWCDTMCASPWMDVARTLLVFAYRKCPVPGIDDVEQANIARQQIADLYYNEYTKYAGENREELEKWESILAAIKINDVPDDYDTMRDIMKRYI